MRSRGLFTFKIDNRPAIAKRLPNPGDTLSSLYQIKIFTGDKWAVELFYFPVNMTIDKMIRLIKGKCEGNRTSTIPKPLDSPNNAL
jgi:hypothetical protein